MAELKREERPADYLYQKTTEEVCQCRPWYIGPRPPYLPQMEKMMGDWGKRQPKRKAAAEGGTPGSAKEGPGAKSPRKGALSKPKGAPNGKAKGAAKGGNKRPKLPALLGLEKRCDWTQYSQQVVEGPDRCKGYWHLALMPPIRVRAPAPGATRGVGARAIPPTCWR